MRMVSEEHFFPDTDHVILKIHAERNQYTFCAGINEEHPEVIGTGSTQLLSTEVMKGTFYFYFEDKYDIRNRIIIAKSYEILHEALNSLPDQNDTFENKVIYVADRIIEKLAADRILLRFIHKNLSWAILENSAEMSETFNDILKQAQQTASYRDVHTMMYLIIELINGACYSAIIYDSPEPIKQLKPKLFDSVRAVMKAFEVPAVHNTVPEN